MSIQTDITAFSKKTGLTGTTILRRLALGTFIGVLKRSPVRHGRFRGSNRISVNAPDLSVEPPIVGSSNIEGQPKRGDPPTAQEFARATRSLAQVRFGDTIHITNALPYAKRLEEGWSSQTPGPRGIYGATFDETTGSFRVTVEAAKAEAARGGAS